MNRQSQLHASSPTQGFGPQFDRTERDHSVDEFLLQDFLSQNTAPHQPVANLGSFTQQNPDVNLDNPHQSSPSGINSNSSSTPLSPRLQLKDEPALDQFPLAAAINEHHDTVPCHLTNSQKPRSIWQIWRMEGLSTAISSLCFVAIIIILRVYQNQPISYQLKMISINSMISIFSAIFKASLIMPVAEGIAQLTWDWFSKPRKLYDLSLFDAASRGPWGSFTFLVKAATRMNEVYLPSLGALITIAALAIDPFTQALVEHVVCRRAMEGGIAQVARTNNYSTALVREDGATLTQSSLESSMHVAIYRGLIDSVNTSSLLNVDCAKGNCTFGSEGDGGYFSSLAVCHSCSDISDNIIKGSKDNYTYSVPVSSFSELKVNSSIALDSHSETTIGVNDFLFSYQALMLNFPANSNHVSGASAVSCTLSPCVKTYSAVVENSIYLEFEEHKKPALILQAFHDSSLVTNSTFVDGKEMECRPFSNPNDIDTIAVSVDPKTHRVLNQPYDTDAHRIYYPRECVWFMDLDTFSGIQVTLRNLLDGIVEMHKNNVITAQNIYGNIWFRNLFEGGNGGLNTANWLFSNLASSMTAAMRNHPFKEPGGPLTKVHGTAYDVTTCINVRWLWISYPAALLLLQVLFCALLLWSRQRTHVGDERVRGDWKSSPLVLLFHGLDENLRWNLGQASSTREMEHVARDIDVQLCQVDSESQPRWRFCAG